MEKDFEDVSVGIEPFMRKMQENEIGKSTGYFTIFSEMIASGAGNSEQMKEYNEIIREMLVSEKSTRYCKKALLRGFAWMAHDSMKDIYEKLASDTLLSGDAAYALKQITKR